MRDFVIKGEYFDESEQCTISTLDYDNGFLFIGKIGSKPNHTGVGGNLLFPLEGAIYFNGKEIYSGFIAGDIEDYFTI